MKNNVYRFVDKLDFNLSPHDHYKHADAFPISHSGS